MSCAAGKNNSRGGEAGTLFNVLLPNAGIDI